MGLILNNINVSMMDSKGWLSADALIAFLVLIILITSFINIISIRIDTVNTIEEASEARALGENIAQQIETTHSNGPGYYTIYRTPRTIFHEYYYVHFNSSGLYIFVNGKTSYSHLSLMRVTGSDYLRDLQVTMKPDTTYNITSTKDTLKNTWIVVKEV
ncbi:MAG: hypothetical protein NKF70_13860 [Methanobacterium sp. ERen5]|nr:MAG: hypothetical protein NKF70_13860 [Methanobacterium sp. ERen5]